MITPHVSSSCLHFYVFHATKVVNRRRILFIPNPLNGMINEQTECIAQKFILQTRKTVCFKKIFRYLAWTSCYRLNWMDSIWNGIATYKIMPQTKVLCIWMLLNVWSALWLCVKSYPGPKHITTERFYFSATLMLSIFRWKCIWKQVRWNKRITWNLQAVETWTVTTDSQMFCGASNISCAFLFLSLFLRVSV